MDRTEIKKYLKSKGFGNTSIEYILDAISEREAIENARNSEEVKRNKDIMEFKPNPGKATLNQIGETKTYVTTDDHGLPIYQEDVDMIKKSQPLAKKLVEVQNERQTLRTLKDIIDEVRNVKPEELNVGPDTTENIHEISESVDETADEEDPNKIHPIDIIRNWTPEEKTKRLVKEFEEYYKEPAATECNKNVSDHGKDYSYSSILRQMDDTHTRKNNDYGDAAYQGYKKYGPAYFLVQLHNKLSRLESLTINNRSQMVKDESIDDTLLDMANYAVMYLESRHRDD